MNKTTETGYTFKSFADVAIAQDSVLRRAAADIASQIIEASDMAVAMQELFSEFRGPYVVAKQGGNKGKQRQLSRAWNASKAALGHHLKQSGFTPNWPNIRSGEGECRLLANTEASEKRREAAAAKLEQEKREAAQFSQEQQQAQLEALRALTLEQLIVEIELLINSSAHNKNLVLGALIGAYTDKDIESCKADVARHQMTASQSEANEA